MTTTTLAPGSQTKIIEALDFRLECDGERCDRAATLSLHIKCGCVELSCMPCRDRSRHWHNDRAALLDGVKGTHQTCGSPVDYRCWEELVPLEVPL